MTRVDLDKFDPSKLKRGPDRCPQKERSVLDDVLAIHSSWWSLCIRAYDGRDNLQAARALCDVSTH